MNNSQIITKGGASFRMEHVLSFSTEKEFVAAYVDELNFSYNKKEIQSTLKAIYREAKLNKKSYN